MLILVLHDILDDDHIQWHPPLKGHYTNFWQLLIWTLLPNLTFYLIVQGFHRTYATGAACQQRTLTPPDTWSCPTLGLACVLMSRPISPELVLSPDFWISNTPRYFSFALYTINRTCVLVTKVSGLCIIYHQQDMCACHQRLSLLIIKYRYYETYLVLVIDICYIVNLIYYKMIWWSVKWCIDLNRN